MFRLHVRLVAADTEEEARQHASLRDAFGRDRRDPRFAVPISRRPTCLAIPSFGPSRLGSKSESERRSGDDMGRERFSLVFC